MKYFLLIRCMFLTAYIYVDNKHYFLWYREKSIFLRLDCFLTSWFFFSAHLSAGILSAEGVLPTVVVPPILFDHCPHVIYDEISVKQKLKFSFSLGMQKQNSQSAAEESKLLRH